MGVATNNPCGTCQDRIRGASRWAIEIEARRAKNSGSVNPVHSPQYS
jgi:hypothetical protein